MSTITKLLPNPPANFSTTLSSSISDSTLTVPLNSVTGLPTEGVGVIYAKDADGNPDATTLEFIHWTNVSGSNLTLSDTGDRGLSGSASGAQSHDSGDTFEVWVHPEYHFYDWGIVDHGTDGTHSQLTMSSTTVTDILDEDTMSSDSATALATQQSIKAYVDNNGASADGWIAADAMTYASAQSVTVTGDQTAKYPVGTKIKLTNDGGTDYYVVKSVSYSSNTTITFATSTDYALANSAITNPYYSYQANPQGWPTWFNFTCTTTANGGGSFTPSFRDARFAVSGRVCHVVLTTNGHNISGTVSSIDFGLPIDDASETSAGYEMGLTGYHQTSSQIIRLFSQDGTKYRAAPTSGNWATVTGGYMGMKFFYEI